MARRLIDISVPLQNDVPADPPGINPRIQYHDHQQSLPGMLGFFEGLKAEDLPDGGDRAAFDPQRHPSRCALPLSSDHESR
jgi:hypothetical protein